MCPFIKITSLQREGRDAYKLSSCNCVISFHAWRNLSIRSSSLLTSEVSECNFLFIESHIFSMILRSGLWAGHSIVKISFSFKYSCTTLETWQGALSCWRVTASSPKYHDIDGLRQFSKISMYFWLSTVPETGTRAPTPLDVTQPQNITAIPFFDSWQIRCGAYFSSDFCHTYSFWSFPTTTMVSSEKITFFHCSIDQFIFSLQNFIRFCLFTVLISLFFFKTLLLNPNCLKCLRMVVWEYLSSLLLLNSLQSFLNDSFRFDFTSRNNKLVSRVVHFDFLPLCPLFSTEFVCWNL